LSSWHAYFSTSQSNWLVNLKIMLICLIFSLSGRSKTLDGSLCKWWL
jgi:hypothetical protein